MKAKLIKPFVYTNIVEWGNDTKNVARIIPAGTYLEIEEIDDYDYCSFWYQGKPLYIPLNLITFDGLGDTSYDLRVWDLDRDSAMLVFDCLRNDFVDLNLTTMRKLLTFAVNTDFHELPSGLQTLVLKYEELKDIILS